MVDCPGKPSPPHDLPPQPPVGRAANKKKSKKVQAMQPNLASRRLPLIAAVLCLASGALAGPSINQFETKELEAEPGNIQFQSQNAYMVGNPRRAHREGHDGESVFDDNSVTRARLAQELEVHLTSFFRTRIGIEFEKERLDDPATFAEADSYAPLRATELQFEGVAILVPVDKGGGVGIGLIAEYQHALVAGDAHSLYMGTILQAVSGPWSATTNLFAVRHFAPVEMTDNGPIRDDKWDFAYAAQVKYHWSSTLDLALEAYGTIDRIGNTGTRDEAALLHGDHDQHRLGPVVYRTFQLGGQKMKHRLGIAKPAAGVAGVGDDDKPGAKGRAAGTQSDDDDDEQPVARLGVGLLAGVTPATPRLTLKWSLEIDF